MNEFDFAQATQTVKDRLCPLIVMIIFLIAASLIIHIKSSDVWIWPAAPQTADAKEILDRMDDDRRELIRVAVN